MAAGRPLFVEEAEEGTSEDDDVKPPAADRAPPAADAWASSYASLCGQDCTSLNACPGNAGCRCIAQAWQSPGSRYYTGTCKLPYASGDGRELNEVELNAPAPANSTITFEGTTLASLTDAACPCNCTYVSNACCSSASGIVHEVPTLKLGALRPPNSSVSCNALTGKFQP